ncbi:hypothetical protein REH65_09505 [Saccharopolyspora sp. ID03-671]|uniref:hypothetical protein n=1 Tax=Saccharopolyspora sp. ID03-671 TaxID=3073066 RepID=UPI00324B583F
MEVSQLPRIDEHSVGVDADPDAVWLALSARLDGIAGAPAGAYARLIGSPDHAASGPRPLAEGSVLPGFRVVSATRGEELTLRGHHRFSVYALRFRIEREGVGRCRLTAESRATFPGVGGAIYRFLVIGTRGHGFAVRRLLAGVASRAELAG